MNRETFIYGVNNDFAEELIFKQRGWVSVDRISKLLSKAREKWTNCKAVIYSNGEYISNEFDAVAEVIRDVMA